MDETEAFLHAALSDQPSTVCVMFTKPRRFGLRDVEAEKARLTKELAKIEAEVAKAEQKLANPAFTQKAPSHVLEENKQRLADWQAKKQRVEQALRDLE